MGAFHHFFHLEQIPAPPASSVVDERRPLKGQGGPQGGRTGPLTLSRVIETGNKERRRPRKGCCVCVRVCCVSRVVGIDDTRSFFFFSLCTRPNNKEKEKNGRRGRRLQRRRRGLSVVLQRSGRHRQALQAVQMWISNLRVVLAST